MIVADDRSPYKPDCWPQEKRAIPALISALWGGNGFRVAGTIEGRLLTEKKPRQGGVLKLEGEPQRPALDGMREADESLGVTKNKL